MTSRERWTVYPLLLLAIGLAMRAAPSPELTTEVLSAAQVRCREIVVETDEGTILIHMGKVVDGGGGRIEIKDAEGVETVAIGTRPGDRDGRVEFFDAEGGLRSTLEAADGDR